MKTDNIDDIEGIIPTNAEAKTASAMEHHQIGLLIEEDPGSALEYKLSSREELFCRHCAMFDERGRRVTIDEAYRKSFYGGNVLAEKKECMRHARTLMRKPKVYERIKLLKEVVDRMVMESIMGEGIAQKAVRIHRMNNDWQRLQDIRDSRARAYARIEELIESKEQELARCKDSDDPEDQTKVYKLQQEIETLIAEFNRSAGGETGLIRREPKTVGKGDASEVVYMSYVDTALLDAMSKLENQAARELGQLVSKVEISKPTKAYVGFDPDQV